MFTGMIEETAGILEQRQGCLRLGRPAAFADVRLGSSIAVSGICLTIAGLDEKSMTFDVVPETLSRTTLGTLQQGDRVNLERALPASGRFEGHIVQGHVEGVGEVVRNGKWKMENGQMMSVKVPKKLLSCIVEKGSIALDGVSLTVAKVDGQFVSVALIPFTLERTTLGTLQEGSTVNIETDILGRYVSSPHNRHRS